MGKTFKDKPEKYKESEYKKKPKDRRFVSSKGREKQELKNQLKDYGTSN